MKKAQWKKRIVTDMTAIGTYRDSYDPVVDTLADILERRDSALKRWKDEGCLLTYERTTDRGAKNLTKNPLLAILEDCEKSALTYWSQLGLTPSGLKKSFAEEQEKAKASLLATALKELGA